MTKKVERNCNSCKHSWLDRCQLLRDELLKNGYNFENSSMANWEISHKIKHAFICDEYDSMFIEYPLEISAINHSSKKGDYKRSSTGKFAKIRPCAEKYQGKTYLGLYLGELPIGNNISFNPETKELNVSFSTNPAIFVFDLGEIVYGMESWWSLIGTEEDLKDITDEDINSVWYMKALRELSKD